MKKRAAWVSTMTLYKKGSATDGARFAQVCLARRQRPKNSHDRIITGIGTPSNQQNSTSHDLLHAFFVIQERKRRDWAPANATETRSAKRLPAAEFQKTKV